MKRLPIGEGERFTQGYFISVCRSVLGHKFSTMKTAELWTKNIDIGNIEKCGYFGLFPVIEMYKLKTCIFV